MPSPRLAAAALAGLLVLAGCGDESTPRPAADDPRPSTTSSGPTTTSSTTETTTSETTLTTEDPDGVLSHEDAAVFVLHSWIVGDRDGAARHATPQVVEQLLATPPPTIESIEFVECDSADLESFDCFFTADGEIIVFTVEELKVVAVELHEEE